MFHHEAPVLSSRFFFFLHDLILRSVIFYNEIEKWNFKAMGFVRDIFFAVADMKIDRLETWTWDM